MLSHFHQSLLSKLSAAILTSEGYPHFSATDSINLWVGNEGSTRSGKQSWSLDYISVDDWI